MHILYWNLKNQLIKLKIKSKILIIAGSDSSGGAGIQADIKTVTSLGSYAMTAITAVTSQNTTGVSSIIPIPAKNISKQIEFTSKDIKPDAIKIGMLHSPPVINSVLNSLNKIKIKKISQSISQIDANNSIGFVAADIGIKQAIKNAKKTGIGLVGIKNSGHYGLSGYYAEQAVKKNLIVFCFTNAPPAIAPHGARKSLFGTNPICFGTPT